MTKARPTTFKGDLKRRQAILAPGKDLAPRRMSAGMTVLAAPPTGPFAVLPIAQTL